MPRPRPPSSPVQSRILFYVQHLLGIGHLVRAGRVAAALASPHLSPARHDSVRMVWARDLLNGAVFGRPEAGIDMTFDFATLIAHAAKTRALGAGTIIGSGTVSNRGADGGPGTPVSAGGRGYNCIAEVRMVETILNGAPATGFLKPGDSVRIEMLDERHHSIFGAIEQTVV